MDRKETCSSKSPTHTHAKGLFVSIYLFNYNFFYGTVFVALLTSNICVDNGGETGSVLFRCGSFDWGFRRYDDTLPP